VGVELQFTEPEEYAYCINSI